MRHGGGTAARGMLWTAASVFSTKVLSVISQIVLGYLIAAETYAVFALATAALALMAGFQNSGASKLLIYNHASFDELSRDYSAFAIQFGVLGGLLLAGLGAVFAVSYGQPILFPVIVIAALGIPLTSLNSVFMARISIDLQFRKLSSLTIAHSVIYFTVLIAIAWLGAGPFSIAVATVVALLGQFFLYRRYAGPVRLGLRLSLKRALEILYTLRWPLFSSVLFGLTQNGDYLILGFFLSPEALGHYYFGFMLTASFGLLLAAGIGQTLFPLFSKLQDDAEALRASVLKMSGAITLLGAVLCVGFAGLMPATVHWLWRGKWDASIFTALALACTFPVRLLASMAAVTFEAKGRWRLRALVLASDATGIMVAAGLGAWWGGLNGAAVFVAAQRGLSGLVAFPFACALVGVSFAQFVRVILQSFAPFAAALVFLILIAPDRRYLAGDTATWALLLGETTVALLIFLAGAFLINRKVVLTLVAFLKERLKK